jgi:hypothetical protein
MVVIGSQTPTAIAIILKPKITTPDTFFNFMSCICQTYGNTVTDFREHNCVWALSFELSLTEDFGALFNSYFVSFNHQFVHVIAFRINPALCTYLSNFFLCQHKNSLFYYIFYKKFLISIKNNNILNI